MELHVWWVTNPPNLAQYYPVESVEEAMGKLKELTDAELLDSSVYSNAGGLEVFEDGGWTEYYDDEGRDIDEIMAERSE